MKSHLTLPTTALFLMFSAISSLENIVWYHPVSGNCSELHPVKNYSILPLNSGEWYFQYTSFGQDGDRCATGHGLQRENNTFVDLMHFEPEKNHYVQFSLDLTYHPDEGGKYTDQYGATGYMLTTDVNYFYYVHCLDVNRQTKVMSVFATRDPVANDEAERVYKEYSEKLASQNLLAPMHHIKNTDCPPLENVLPGKAIFN